MITKQKRGAYRRKECVFVGAWIPSAWIANIEALVVAEDSDRSKIIRKAIELKIRESK